jgi:hypothetical protein
VPVRESLDTADHARAAAVGHDRDPGPGTGVEDRLHAVRVAGPEHRVRGVVQPAGPQANQIRIAATGGVADALVRPVRHLAGHGADRLGNGPRLGQ